MKTKIALFVVFTFLAVTQNIAQTPTLQTRKATNVNAITPHTGAGSFTATLNGIVNANGTNCYVFFEYGETENYGFNVSATPGTVTGSSDVNISANITIPNNQLSSVRTKINFRIKVINENDTYCSQNFVATAVNPTRKIDIQPEYSNGSNSLMTLINYNSYDVTVVYKDVNSVTVYAMQTSEIYVPENEVITFEYDYILFRQILPTTRLSTEPKLSRDYIRIKNLGRINSSNVQLYKIYNSSSTQAVNVSVEEVPSATNITIEANSAVFFVEQAGGYAPTISVDGVQFANVSPDVYYYEEGFYLDIQSLSSTPSSATFEIYNRDDVAHTYVFRNASGTEHTYTLNGYEIQNITLSNEVWDVYITVYDKDEPDSYSFIRTGNTFGYAEYALNGKLKIASATPAEVPPLTPGITSLTQNSPTSFTANGAISGNPAQSETVNYYFIYGTDPDNLNQSTTLQQVTILAGQDANVSQEISFLTNETFYYCKLVSNTTQSESKKIFLSPLPTANLKMHLRADLEITSSSNYVSTWGDVSGFDNDAIQTNGANQPMWVDNQINGNPIIRFNGTTSKMNLPTSTTLGIQNNAYEMFFVAKSSLGDVQFLIAGSSLEQYEYHLNGAAGARFIPTTSVYLDKASDGNYSDGNTHVFSARASSTGGAVRVDGIDGGTSSSNILSSNSGNLLLGIRSDGSYYLNGDIAEVILYNAVLSTEDRNAVEQYLADRYNITSGELPVELTSFTAINNGNEVVLNWQTATEVNNYGFEIERCVAQISNLCNNWETIGFVEGHGNSNSPKDYTFTDSQTFEVFQNLEGFDGVIQYRLKQLDIDGQFKYSDVVEVSINSELPTEFSLEQNYPNPFNPSTKISFNLPTNSFVTLKVYNAIGEEIATLVRGNEKVGIHEVTFDASKFASGIYFYEIKSNKHTITKKMLLLR
ncbi:MAG: T9SS type A sorting domain-containing protein [Bacteroidetes bacterium]|nr:T9SS type A sorting domain-containing protein [Bacteroidota bacterium]MBU1799772.1 T9SS type A sorting domain-containing protein [Bacteroidota bacterium]